jgi:hypothetical protein
MQLLYNTKRKMTHRECVGGDLIDFLVNTWYFNDHFEISSNLIMLNSKILVNDKTERMWKEAVVACIKVPKHLRGRTEENHGKCHDSRTGNH